MTSDQEQQQKDARHPKTLESDSFDSEFNIGDIVVDLDNPAPAPAGKERRRDGKIAADRTSDCNSGEDEESPPLKAGLASDEGALSGNSRSCKARYKRLALVVGLLIIGSVLAAVLAVLLTGNRDGPEKPNESEVESNSDAVDFVETTWLDADSTEKAPPPNDIPELTACVCDAGKGDGLRVGGIHHECLQNAQLTYRQGQIAASLAICIFPSDARKFVGHQVPENGLDVAMKHLESDISFVMSSTFIASNSDDIVRLHRNTTSNAMIFTLLHPVTEIFPNLRADFSGTLEVAGEVQLEHATGAATFQISVELVEPAENTATGTGTLSLSSCICRSVASDDIDAAASEGNELLRIGGTDHRCAQDNQPNFSPLSICLFPEDDVLKFKGYQINKHGLNLTMRHLQTGRPFTIRNGEVLVHRKDIVRLDQNSTSNAMVISILAPLMRVFPNLVLDFSGTMQVAGKVPLVPKDGRKGEEDVRALSALMALPRGSGDQRGDVSRRSHRARKMRGFDVADGYHFKVATFHLAMELIAPTQTPTARLPLTTPPITPTQGPTTSSTTPRDTCQNTPDYSDKYGDGCDYYEADENFPNACQHFGGETNGKTDTGGGSPNENCCACRGLASSDEPTTMLQQSPSLGSCTNAPDFKDAYGDGCEYYEAEENYPHACQHFGEEGGGSGTPNENCCECKALLPSP